MHETLTRTPDRRLWPLIATWTVISLFIFFSAHGAFSFQESGSGQDQSEPSLVQVYSDAATQAARIERAVACLLVLILALPHLWAIRRLRSAVPWLGWLAALSIVSVLWSQFPFRTIVFIVFFLTAILFAGYLYVRFCGEDQMKLVCASGAIVAASCVFLIFALPKYGIHQGELSEWKGIFHTKNVCARSLIFLAAPAFHLTLRRGLPKAIRLLYLLSMLFLVNMTQSLTGRMIALLYIFYVLATKVAARINSKDANLVALVATLSIGSILLLAFPDPTAILNNLGKDATLTHRVDIWRAVLDSIAKHPVLGYGYGGFWSAANGEAFNVSIRLGWMVPYSHNGFLDVWLDLGIAGLALIIFGVARSVQDAAICLNAKRSKYSEWCAGVVLLTILYNLDEGTFLAQNELSWILFCLACIALSIEAKNARSANRSPARQILRAA